MLTIACSLMSDKVTSLLIGAENALGFSFGVRAQTEMKIWCVKGLYKLKVVSQEKKVLRS